MCIAYLLEVNAGKGAVEVATLFGYKGGLLDVYIRAVNFGCSDVQRGFRYTGGFGASISHDGVYWGCVRE